MIFFDIDTQYDFLDREGALFVTDSESIFGNLERLLRFAGEKQITTISTRCAHQPGDAEFEIFPPHCIEGTRGAGRVFADLPALPRHIIEINAQPTPGEKLLPGTHYIVKKNVFDPFSSPWLCSWRDSGELRGRKCIVFGVATDYCVRDAALGLTQAGAFVTIVEDAVRGVAPESTAAALNKFKKAQISFTTTDKLIHSSSRN
jgi:nicotinamidase/pyrazinamidase